MSKIKLKIKVSKDHFVGLKLVAEKYGVSIDEAVEMAIERLFLSELGILLVPKNVVDKNKGVIVIDDNYSVRDITAFK